MFASTTTKKSFVFLNFVYKLSLFNISHLACNVVWKYCTYHHWHDNDAFHCEEISEDISYGAFELKWSDITYMSEITLTPIRVIHVAIHLTGVRVKFASS